MRKSLNGLLKLTAIALAGLQCNFAFGQVRGPAGACCLPNGECEQTSQFGCEKDGGQWNGPESFCGNPARGGVLCEPFGPPNSQCQDAIALTIGVSMEGTVRNVTGSNNDLCFIQNRGDGLAGVWYSVIGNGGLLEATVCGLESPRSDERGGLTSINVYCGSCDPLICVIAGQAPIEPCRIQRGGPSATWCSEPGQSYLLFIALDDEPVDTFQILITDVGQSCIAESCGPPNDECENAIPILTLGEPILGSTEDALSDAVPQCVPLPALSLGFFPNGVWYSVTGTGNIMSAELCIPLQRGKTDPEVPFDGLIQVFCGGCEDLNCVGGGYGRLQPCIFRGGVGAEWCSEIGREYLILVALERVGKGRGIDPYFLLTVSDSQKPCMAEPCGLANDECINAINLEASDFVIGNTTGATPSMERFCNFDPTRGNTPDVWYRVVGNGQVMEARLCYASLELSEIIGRLDVYCGDCANLNCVASAYGEPDYCYDLNRAGGTVDAQWCSESGRDYFIRVTWAENQGDFGLGVISFGKECEPEPCGEALNDFCEDAQPICPGEIYIGDTFEATNDYLDHGAPINTVFFCGPLMALYDNWYSYTPSEAGLLFVHVEQLPTEWVFGVYDDCPEYGGNLLKCNSTRHHGVIIVQVQPYHKYYIRIAGFLESRGTYILDILGPPCLDMMP